MKQEDRPREIKAFWESKPRQQPWEEILWEPFYRHGDRIITSADKAQYSLKNIEYIFWTPGVEELEIAENFEWEWALLDLIYVWYSLPDYVGSPICINEEARAIFIPELPPTKKIVECRSSGSFILGEGKISKTPYRKGKKGRDAKNESNP